MRLLAYMAFTLLLSGCSICSTSAGSKTAGVVCRISEGTYDEAKLWRPSDDLTVSRDGAYVLKSYSVWEIHHRTYECKGRLPPDLLQPLLSSSSLFPIQNGVPTTNLCQDSTFTIPRPAGVDAALSYVHEKHLPLWAGRYRQACVDQAAAFFNERRAEAAKARLKGAAYNLKRTAEFWRGKAGHTTQVRQSLEKLRAEAVKDIIDQMRKLSGEDLGDSAQAWVRKYCPEPNQPLHSNGGPRVVQVIPRLLGGPPSVS